MKSFPPHPPPASQGDLGASSDVVAAMLRDQIATGFYVPGTRLTLRALRGATGYSYPELRPALERLVPTGLIRGRWHVVDHRPPDHGIHRTRRLLVAMIDHGAFPPGTELPVGTDLAKALLTTPVTVKRALRSLADDGVLHLSRSLHARSTASACSAPSPDAWLSALADVQRAQPQRSATPFDRDVIRGIRDFAQGRWRSGICLPSHVMTVQETLQRDVLCRLVHAACEQVAGRGEGEDARLRSVAACAMACASQPVEGLQCERLFRFAVLATALADLADELASHHTHHTLLANDRSAAGRFPEAPCSGGLTASVSLPDARRAPASTCWIC